MKNNNINNTKAIRCIFALLLLFNLNCLCKQQKIQTNLSAGNNKPTGYAYTKAKSPSEQIVEAIEQNNHSLFIDLIEKQNLSIPEIDQQEALISKAIDAFVKRKNKDLFMVLYLLASGASFSDVDIAGIETLIYFDDPQTQYEWSQVLKHLIAFEQAATAKEKRKALKAAINASTPFLSNGAQADGYNKKSLTQKVEHTYAGELVFPKAPESIDTDLLDWVLLPTQEEKKAAFKKLLEEKSENPDDWEWVE